MFFTKKDEEEEERNTNNPGMRSNRQASVFRKAVKVSDGDTQSIHLQRCKKHIYTHNLRIINV